MAASQIIEAGEKNAGDGSDDVELFSSFNQILYVENLDSLNAVLYKSADTNSVVYANTLMALTYHKNLNKSYDLDIHLPALVRLNKKVNF